MLRLADLTYSEKSYDTSSTTTGPISLCFNSDGTKMYVGDQTDDKIYQFTLSTAWDVSTASYASKSFDFNAEGSICLGIALSPAGTTLLIYNGTTTDTIYQYTLSTIDDISTASYASKSLDLSSHNYDGDAMAVSPDGKEIYVPNGINHYQWSLTAGWDLSTASYTDTVGSIGGLDNSIRGYLIGDEGKCVIIGTANETIQQFELTTAYDITTISPTTLEDGIDISGDITSLTSIGVGDSYSKLYTINSSTGVISQFDILTTDLVVSGTIPQVSGYLYIDIIQTDISGAIPHIAGDITEWEDFETEVSGIIPGVSGEITSGLDIPSNLIPFITGSLTFDLGVLISIEGSIPSITGSIISGADVQNKVPGIIGALSVLVGDVINVTGKIPAISGNVEVQIDMITAVSGKVPRIRGSLAVEIDGLTNISGSIPHVSGALGLKRVVEFEIAGKIPSITSSVTMSIDTVMNISGKVTISGGIILTNETRLSDYVIRYTSNYLE